MIHIELTKDEAYTLADAAERWAAELREWIAPASDNYGDTESAEGQRENAAQIDPLVSRIYGAISSELSDEAQAHHDRCD